MSKTKNLSPESTDNFMEVLKLRFENNMHLHPKIKWEDVEKILEKNPEKLTILEKMEESGGEPNVVVLGNSNKLCFIDCSTESPKGRRSFCYDRSAWEKRKEHKPENTVIDFAAELGSELLNEDQYRLLQKLDAFDLKTSSWIKTTDHIRKLGGAIFCDRRYNTVFTYHNGAESYYAARGFRTILEI